MGSSPAVPTLRPTDRIAPVGPTGTDDRLQAARHYVTLGGSPHQLVRPKGDPQAPARDPPLKRLL